LDFLRAIDVSLSAGRVEFRTEVKAADLDRSYGRVPPPQHLRHSSEADWLTFAQKEKRRFRAAFAQGEKYVPTDPGRVLIEDARVDSDCTFVEEGCADTELEGILFERVGERIGLSAPVVLAEVSAQWLRRYRTLDVREFPLVVLDSSIVGSIGFPEFAEWPARGASVWLSPRRSWLWRTPWRRCACLLGATQLLDCQLAFICEVTEDGSFVVALPLHAGQELSVSVESLSDHVIHTRRFVRDASSSERRREDVAGHYIAACTSEATFSHTESLASQSEECVGRHPLLTLGCAISLMRDASPHAISHLADLELNDAEARLLRISWLRDHARSNPARIIEATALRRGAGAELLLSAFASAAEPTDDALEELVELSRRGDPSCALAAIEAFLRMGGTVADVVPQLKKQLESDDPEVSLLAIYAVGDHRLRHVELTDALRHTMLRGEARSRALAAASLERVGLGGPESRLILAHLSPADSWLASWATGE
jgi:hypothetical protein